MEKEEDKRLEHKRSEGKSMGVAKGVMSYVPKEHTAIFLDCFKKSNINMDKLKKLSTIHEDKDKK